LVFLEFGNHGLQFSAPIRSVADGVSRLKKFERSKNFTGIGAVQQQVNGLPLSIYLFYSIKPLPDVLQ